MHLVEYNIYSKEISQILLTCIKSSIYWVLAMKFIQKIKILSQCDYSRELYIANMVLTEFN